MMSRSGTVLGLRTLRTAALAIIAAALAPAPTIANLFAILAPNFAVERHANFRKTSPNLAAMMENWQPLMACCFKA
jgi:hypothetical protein